ncbi:hypothetical protein ACQW5G_00570 [Fructilactobacillus sp. Tb1]|uniref:hypothetical protein n=1 Tax=Fructilactobacillus sp. Tb1 TaxID=3422304 RepID=UPI003D28DB1E
MKKIEKEGMRIRENISERCSEISRLIDKAELENTMSKIVDKKLNNKEKSSKIKVLKSGIRCIYAHDEPVQYIDNDGNIIDDNDIYELVDYKQAVMDKLTNIEKILTEYIGGANH